MCRIIVGVWEYGIFVVIVGTGIDVVKIMDGNGMRYGDGTVVVGT